MFKPTIQTGSGFPSINDLDPKTNLNANDIFLIEDSQDTFSEKKTSFANIISSFSTGGPATWGLITGDIEDQSDLQAVLDEKATVSHTQLATTVELAELGTATYDDLQDFVNSTQSGGRISGGVITETAPADGTIAVSALKGFVKITTSDIAETKFFDYAGTTAWGASGTGTTLTDNATNYLYIDYNAGTPILKCVTDRSTLNETTQFTLGRVFKNGNDIEVLMSGINLYNRTRKIHERWIDTFGGISYANGIITSCTGLKPAITGGTLYAGSNKITISAKDCNAGGTFDAYYYNPTTAQWVIVTGQTSLDNTQYNKADTGTGLATLTSTSRYAVHWLYVCPEGEIYALYGKGDYTLSQAQAATVTTPIPNYLSQWAKLAAKIIIQKSSATVYSITMAWSTQFPVQTQGEHNAQAGLQGGTTDQYYHLTAAELPVAQGSIWIPETAFTAAPASTSTLTMTSDRTATLKILDGLKYVIGGVTYHGVIASITSNLLTIRGAPLSGDVTSLYYSHVAVRSIQLIVAGSYEDANDASLVVNDLKQYLVWPYGPAKIVYFRLRSYGGADASSNGYANIRCGQPIVSMKTAQSADSTHITLAADASAVHDYYNGMWIEIVGGTGVKEARLITDYDGSTKIATVATWDVTPDSSSIYRIFTPVLTTNSGAGLLINSSGSKISVVDINPASYSVAFEDPIDVIVTKGTAGDAKDLSVAIIGVVE